MLFPILFIWIQLLLQKDDLFLGALFTLLFKPVLVHFCGFSINLLFPLPWTFTIKTGHGILEVLGWGAGGGCVFNFKSVLHIKFLNLCVYIWTWNSISAMIFCWDYMKLSLCLFPQQFFHLEGVICICSSQMSYFILDVLTYILLDYGI